MVKMLSPWLTLVASFLETPHIHSFTGQTWALKKAQEKKLEVADMRMLRWMCGVTKLDKIRNERIRVDNESGGNHKESPGKEVEMVWACEEKRGALRRKEGDGNESTGEKEERKT